MHLHIAVPITVRMLSGECSVLTLLPNAQIADVKAQFCIARICLGHPFIARGLRAHELLPPEIRCQCLVLGSGSPTTVLLCCVKTKQSSFHAGAPTCLLEPVEFVFLPDVPVQCFDVPAAMLCVMGQRTKKTHYRDGMDFRADLLWLPDTANTDMAMVLKSSQIQQPKHMCWSQCSPCEWEH